MKETYYLLIESPFAVHSEYTGPPNVVRIFYNRKEAIRVADMGVKSVVLLYPQIYYVLEVSPDGTSKCIYSTYLNSTPEIKEELKRRQEEKKKAAGHSFGNMVEFK